MVLGIICLLIGGFCLVPGVGGAVSPSSFQARAWDDFVLITGGLCFLWLGVRAFRIGVKVTAGKLIIHNELRTRVVTASDIRAITLEPRAIGDGLARWIGRVHLADGSRIWIDDFDCGLASRPPKPELTAKVEEIMALLGVRPAEIDTHEPRQETSSHGL